MKNLSPTWDPAGEETSIADSLRANTEKLDAQLTQYAAHPYAIRNLLLVLLLAAGGIVVSSFWMAPPVQEATLTYLIIGLIPVGLYVAHVSGLQTDLVKAQLARSQGWLYDPTPSRPRWAALRQQYPSIFDKGTKSQHVTDQFWGVVEHGKQRTPFWTGEFKYTREAGDRSTNHHELVVAVQLDTAVVQPVIIEPDALGLTEHPLTTKDLQLEANEFNRLFSVVVDKHDTGQHKQVYQTLNPALMATLIDFRTTCGNFRALFSGDVFFVSFPGQSLRPTHTNFFRKVEVDPRDVVSFYTRLQTVLQFAQRIRQQLDNNF